jgi:hypothetical protein
MKLANLVILLCFLLGVLTTPLPTQASREVAPLTLRPQATNCPTHLQNIKSTLPTGFPPPPKGAVFCGSSTFAAVGKLTGKQVLSYYERTLSANGCNTRYIHVVRRVVTPNVYRLEFSCPNMDRFGAMTLDNDNTRVSTYTIDSYPIRNAAAFEPFEHGMMIWLGKTIFVLFDNGDIWYPPDMWIEGESLNYPDLPPSGLFAPQRGFGKLWTTDATVRGRLGWATAPEQGYTLKRLWFDTYTLPDGRLFQQIGEGTKWKYVDQ